MKFSNSVSFLRIFSILKMKCIQTVVLNNTFIHFLPEHLNSNTTTVFNTCLNSLDNAIVNTCSVKDTDLSVSLTFSRL